MQIIKRPHELLIRWGRDGLIQGHHVITVDQACDDEGNPILLPNGEVMLEKFSEPMSLDKAGHTLDGLLAKSHEDALAALAEANEKVATLEARIESMEAGGA